jgi:hypothetical protein
LPSLGASPLDSRSRRRQICIPLAVASSSRRSHLTLILYRGRSRCRSTSPQSPPCPRLRCFMDFYGLSGWHQESRVSTKLKLLLRAAAYWLLNTLRRKLVRSGVRRMQLDTLRLMLIKVGGCNELDGLQVEPGGCIVQVSALQGDRRAPSMVARGDEPPMNSYVELRGFSVRVCTCLRKGVSKPGP